MIPDCGTWEQQVHQGQILVAGSSSKPGTPCACTATSNPTPLPDPCPLLRGRAQGSGSPLGLPAQPKAAQLVPSITPGSPVKPGMCPFQGNTDLLKGMACTVSRVGSTPRVERGKIHNLTAQPGLAALPAKSSKEHCLDRRRLGRKQVLNTQHTTSSSATACSEPALGRH